MNAIIDDERLSGPIGTTTNGFDPIVTYDCGCSIGYQTWGRPNEAE